ncbi:SGT1-domain-containing protein [Trametes gibbosa]|nr:SGT1-domain-containing protein [Trametes gibbosa]KAI0828304.1 SGT1-domain-containing protein [Trametes gibbosa]
MVSVNDIFNRPPTISEDTLQYTLYLPESQTDRVSATSLAALIAEFTQNALPEHLWHRDTFEIKVAPDPEEEQDVWVLEGRMRVGDCIDDEWCAVWLLREISRNWDVAVSVWDSDGDFLLIEAADELPSWVNPCNSENRVWIHNSRLHLIPLSHVSAPSSKTRRRRQQDTEEREESDEPYDEQEFITATDAVKLVRDPLVQTLAPERVEQVAWMRITGYPAASRQHIHVTQAYLPTDISKALTVNPPLVQKAVEAFYTRDALQLRAAQKMARFPPEPAVLTAVKMTRTAYAQLVGQKFHPPKVFGRWTETDGSKQFRWREVGMKIACGFEMLYQESKSRKDTLSANFDGSVASAEALKDNLRRNPEYAPYLQRLVAAGYFKGELEGSQLWTILENQAASAFVAARKEDDATRPSFASVVQTSLNQYSDDQRLPVGEEDSDDWLNVDAADFNAMLEKTVGADNNKGKDKALDPMDVDPTEDEEERAAKAQAARLKDLAKQVEDFVEGEGDLEGARFADEGSSDEGDGDSDDTNGSDDEDDDDMDVDEDKPVSGPSLSQLTAEERKARQDAMDKLVPGIDPSEYGKMPPAFHSNSQRTAPATLDTELRDEPPTTPGTPEAAPARPIRPPILPRDQYDGVDSDDETDEDEVNDEDDEDEDEQPQVVGEIEIDMAEEEDEFIEFARQALGVSDQQWQEIMRERSERGAFVPTRGFAPNRSAATTATPQKTLSRDGKSSQTGPDTTLDSFEAVMRAMDQELARARGQPAKTDSTSTTTLSPPSKGKGKRKASAEETSDSEDGPDIEAAMEAELRASLDGGEFEDELDEAGEGTVDYKLIKNFLESFKSQAGASGPVGNLVGRLQQGWTLPRDVDGS